MLVIQLITICNRVARERCQGCIINAVEVDFVSLYWAESYTKLQIYNF